ncbi:hypothetical protein EDD37DRAFT_653268 [Exophiala viscosa]|uniref:Uncharacterized protein n=1 Tax=Exophiala viscosa TaxID=2486360 RepID=A0AAN6DN66_9EURO|nr:hypothetical protein EDD36DRAFT_422825 [Exophiala viscosa]KAI1620963.1 hypothetical protein EDD37DRAFT_653268 [Exophiala viscosa]
MPTPMNDAARVPTRSEEEHGHGQSNDSACKEAAAAPATTPTNGRGGSKTAFMRRSTRKMHEFSHTVMQFLDNWWMEILSCVAIIVALMAIILTANAYRDQPLPKWPHGLSINTLISIYVAILKAARALILGKGLSHLKWTWFGMTRPLKDLGAYDDASKGPLGSIQLLYILYGRDVISCVAALIVVAATVLDPVAQQVFRYYNCQRSDPANTNTSSNATIPRTNSHGVLIDTMGGLLPPGLRSAINAGVFAPGSIVPFDCSSGNCTFPDTFHTMGYASTCSDVSNEVHVSNVTVPMNITTFIDFNGTLLNETDLEDVTIVRCTLPSGLNTTLRDIDLFQSDGEQTPSRYMVMAYNYTTSVMELIVGPIYVDLSLDRFEGCSDPNSWRCRGYGAARCAIRPAVFAIKSSVEAGRLSENITFATDQFNPAGWSASSTAQVSCLNATQKASLGEPGYEIPSDLDWLPYNVSYRLGEYASWNNGSFMTDESMSIVPADCIYSSEDLAYFELDEGMGLPGFNPPFFTSYFDVSVWPVSDFWDGDNVALAFYNDGNISFDSVDSMFANISSSVTTYIRQHGDVNSSAPALGKVLTTETCIHVRWPLLSYPAALAFLTILFFMAMVARTTQAKEGINHDLKADPLALLFHGLDESLLMKVQDRGECGEGSKLSEQTKEMLVSFRPTDEGWKFVGGRTEEA